MRLQRLGYPVFWSEPRRLLDIARTIERLGTLAGTVDDAQTSATALRGRVADLERAAMTARPLRVFYQVWGRPLITVNAEHLIDDALRTCGARNVFATGRRQVVQPSQEAVLLTDPDVIIVATSPGQAAADIARWRKWQSLRAVREGRVATVDASLLHRPTPRMLDGIQQLCRQIAAARE